MCHCLLRCRSLFPTQVLKDLEYNYSYTCHEHYYLNQGTRCEGRTAGTYDVVRTRKPDADFQGEVKSCEYTNPFGCSPIEECKPENLGTFDAQGVKVATSP